MRNIYYNFASLITSIRLIIMKSYLLLLFAVFTVSILSCSKECKSNDTGEIHIENRATYQAEVTVNTDDPFIMEPNEEITLTLPSGTYFITAVEVGGLMISTGFNGRLDVCSTNNLVIGR